ncbi:MAG: hypothetical protein P8N52_07205 [Crocinitomicaceae bacterium]|nr:hypothetical protein [Crocinitomicaceae bacterium]MDG1775832.1 hypothetical protein [Crocinitomicaceae bacterium]
MKINLKKTRIITLGLVMNLGFLFAQEGNVKIIKDNRIDALVKQQGEVIPPALNPTIDGFRIQLFFDSQKSEINAAKLKFMSQYKTIDTYVSYNAPNFFLKVGDFRTRLEAEKIKAQITAAFPTSFIVKEKINLPRLEKSTFSN